MKKEIKRKSYFGLIIAAFVVGLLSAVLGITLKIITEIFEHAIFEESQQWHWLFILTPSIGITLIFFTRKYLFRGKKNKGIAEIFQTLDHRKDELPFYKVPSHYINGFLTVIFGGSTGIEVSTVVATAAIGASAHRKDKVANTYKTELVCAGVAAGITALFGSPIAGFLFAVEVISRKVTKTILLSCLTAVIVAWGLVIGVGGDKLFAFEVSDWKIIALPFIIVLSCLAALMAVFFTKSVIFIKEKFAKIKSNFIRVNFGAILVGIAIFFLPELYGDSYHALSELLNPEVYNQFSFLLLITLFCLVILKPIVASLTLGAGGDGGVFAPSIVTGAILGIFVAVVSNHFFHTDLIVLNFALIGAGAMLSAAIHAPLTSLFLTCAIVDGGYNLFLPILIGVYIAKYLANYICKYTVYTYKRKKNKLSITLHN